MKHRTRAPLSTPLATLAMALSAAAGVQGCGGPLQVKAMVAEGRWTDACRAIHPSELTDQATDISMPEFDALVMERAKAKVDVKVAPRLIVEQMLGGNPRLRRSPRRAQGLAEMDPVSDRAQRYLEDRVLLLWHVASAGPLHATMSDPKLSRRGGVGGAVGSPASDGGALASGLGFRRSASECDNSISTIASRLLEKVARTPGLDLTCSSTEGREPSAEEQAFVDAIAPAILSKPCAPGAAACTRVALFAPFDLLDHRVGELAFDVEIPVETGCSTRESLQLPLRTTDIKRLDTSIRSLFPAGPRSLTELLALQSQPAPAEDAPAVEGASGQAGKGRCQDEMCKAVGRCLDEAGQCLIGGDADCKASDLCKVEGWCSAVKGGIVFGAGSIDSVCAAGADADCASSEACKVAGQCAAVEGRCVAGTSAHCLASEACSRFGLCSAAGPACRAVADADCQRSALCKEWSACHAEAGVCR